MFVNALTLILSMAMFVPLHGVGRTSIESEVVAKALDKAIANAEKVAPSSTSIPVSPTAEKYPDAVAQYKANGMTEPVPVATHKVYREMHNLIFQKADVMLDASVAYNPETHQIDVLGGGTEILAHETIFNPYSLFWVIAVAVLVFPPLLNTTYRSGSRLVLLWEVSMLATILASITGFVTLQLTDQDVSDRYMIALIFNSLAIMAGYVAYHAAKRNEPVSWHAAVYGPCMLASAAAFMFPW